MALFALCLVGCENGSGQKKSDYVDLGLPSGTKWKKANEKNLMPYADAMGLYKGMMPTIEQWQELRDECVCGSGATTAIKLPVSMEKAFGCPQKDTSFPAQKKSVTKAMGAIVPPLPVPVLCLVQLPQSFLHTSATEPLSPFASS